MLLQTCPTNWRSVIQDQRVGTIQSFSSQTLYAIFEPILLKEPYSLCGEESMSANELNIKRGEADKIIGAVMKQRKLQLSKIIIYLQQDLFTTRKSI